MLRVKYPGEDIDPDVEDRVMHYLIKKVKKDGDTDDVAKARVTALLNRLARAFVGFSVLDKCLLMITGEMDSGKSYFVDDVISKMLEGICSTMSGSQFFFADGPGVKNPYKFVGENACMGKRLNFVDEGLLNLRYVDKEANRLKECTNPRGKLRMYDDKGLGWYREDVRCHSLLCFAINHGDSFIKQLIDVDDAHKGRWEYVKFQYQPPEENQPFDDGMRGALLQLILRQLRTDPQVRKRVALKPQKALVPEWFQTLNTTESQGTNQKTATEENQREELKRLFDFDAPEKEVMLVTHGVMPFLKTLPAEAEAGGRRFVRSNSINELLTGGRASSNVRTRMEEAAGRRLPPVNSLNVRPGWMPIEMREQLKKTTQKATAVIGVRVKQEVLDELAAYEGGGGNVGNILRDDRHDETDNPMHQDSLPDSQTQEVEPYAAGLAQDKSQSTTRKRWAEDGEPPAAKRPCVTLAGQEEGGFGEEKGSSQEKGPDKEEGSDQEEEARHARKWEDVEVELQAAKHLLLAC